VDGIILGKEKELEIERRSLAMPRSRDLCLTFSAIADDMLTDYLQRMKQQIMGWFGNIKKQKIEVLSATDNTLMTSTPEVILITIVLLNTNTNTNTNTNII
jgi:hypothetical protein